MNTYLDTRIIALNSKDGRLLNGTYKSNIEFQFNGMIKQEENIENIQISLVNGQIPVSFYTVNYTNNILKIALGLGIIQYITVPVGNYNATTLISAITTLINDSNFNITISKIHGLITLTYNNSFMLYTDNVSSIGQILGFDLGTSYTCNILYTLTSPYPLDLLGYKRLEIYSQTLQTYNYSSLNSGMSTILWIIPVDQPSWGLITYNNFTDTKYILQNTTLDSIDIQIKGEDENFINFNNIDWCLKLKLDITRKKSIEITNLNLNDLNSNTKDISNNEIIKNDLDLLNYN